MRSKAHPGQQNYFSLVLTGACQFGHGVGGLRLISFTRLISLVIDHDTGNSKPRHLPTSIGYA